MAILTKVELIFKPIHDPWAERLLLENFSRVFHEADCEGIPG